VKSRSTRSAGRSVPSPEMVVFAQDLPLRTPDTPIWRINRSTVQRATRIPSVLLRWSHILSAPYAAKFSSCTRAITGISSASRTARAEGGRVLAA
jgi:hypothetical protein